MNQPRIQIRPSSVDIVINTASWTLLVLLWVITAVNYPTLPEVIPIHFNFSGEADGHAGKLAYWMFPVVTTGLFLLLTLISRYPHALNYPVKITEENAPQQYSMAKRFIGIMRLVIVGIFIYGATSVASIAGGHAAVSSPLPVLIMLGVLVSMILIYMVLASKKK